MTDIRIVWLYTNSWKFHHLQHRIYIHTEKFIHTPPQKQQHPLPWILGIPSFFLRHKWSITRPVLSGMTLCCVGIIAGGAGCIMVNKGWKWEIFPISNCMFFILQSLTSPLSSYFCTKSHYIISGVTHCIGNVIIPLTLTQLNMNLSKKKLEKTGFRKEFTMPSVCAAPVLFQT